MPLFFRKKDSDDSGELEEVVVQKDTKMDAITTQIANLTKMVTNVVENQKILKAEMSKANYYNNVISYAKKFGMTDEQATELAGKEDLSYEQKLEACLNTASEFKGNVIKAFTSTSPVGDLTTTDLVQGDTPKTSSEALNKVSKEFGISGMEAYTKAKLMYPEVSQSRHNKFKS